MRFINSYLNVDFAPNVTMRTAYMNTYPHILIGKNPTFLYKSIFMFANEKYKMLISSNPSCSFLLLAVATRDIEPGEEFLLDYGEAYNKAFLLPQPKSVNKNIEAAIIESELPGGLVEEDVRENSGETCINANNVLTAVETLDLTMDKMMSNLAV